MKLITRILNKIKKLVNNSKVCNYIKQNLKYINKKQKINNKIILQ